MDRPRSVYRADTPLEQPLGGSQSALCYLAVELSRLGHAVTVFNGIASLTTRLGALPETTAGHAPMIDWQEDKSRLAKPFADLVIGTLREMMRDPTTAGRQRSAMIKLIRENYLWQGRAVAWSAWLTELARTRA